ncbi:MAG TPA: VWA domain-containing protein [Terracidiphilus sp.]|nr:VWA domain-containing protein [Terracidiphilus sp.]
MTLSKLGPGVAEEAMRTMIRWPILGLFAIVAHPAWAAKRVSIVQLKQTLSAMVRAHRTDLETALQISKLDPSQRISDATLVRLINLYAPGPQASVALQLFADRSSFLQLPPDELPSISAPSSATQQSLLEMARKFARQTLPQLPNLLATRTTYSFDDSPWQVKKDAWPVQAGLHLVDVTKTEVSVRNEKENIAAALPGSYQPRGLMTWGEFGSALLMVVNDSARGTTTWSHWEQVHGGPVAVFNYSVPKSASHYEIATPADRITHIQGSDRWFANTVAATDGHILSSPGDAKRMAYIKPAYHGSIWIDPASGTILRITIIARTDQTSNLDRAATLVEYGPVHMGGTTFVCPTRSFALSDAPSNVGTALRGATTEWLNENLFTNYHLFATSTRIVGRIPGETKPAEVGPQSSVAASPAPALPAPSPATHLQPPENASAALLSEPAAAMQLPPAPSLPAVTSAPPEQAASPAPTPQPASAAAFDRQGEQPLGASPADTAPAPPSAPPDLTQSDSSLTLHVNVNAVLIPVVIRDAHGRSIDDLQEQDFRLFDNGKPRPLSGFLVEERAAPPKIQEGAITSNPEARAISVPQKTTLPGRFTVFVFDDLNLTASQIAYAQQAAMETVGDALAGSGLAAVVTTSGKINSGLTSDPAILTNAIGAVHSIPLYRSDESECPKLDYYQADLIANKHDPAAIADALQQDLTVCVATGDRNTSQDANPSLNAIPAPSDSDSLVQAARAHVEAAARLVLQRAARDALTTCAALQQFVIKLATLPGQRTMILMSAGFPPADAEVMEAESRLINLADQSGVTIDALNAAGVSPAGLQASDNTTRVRNPLLITEYREMEMQGKQNAMWDLADGTGGRFFHDNNDLAAGFSEMLQAPGTVYLLELTLNGAKPNGAWHRITVKTDQAGAQVQARQGYFAPSRHVKR